MESLTEVCSLLRHDDRHELTNLLTSAYVDFEVYDIGVAITGDGEFDVANAVIYAPVSAVNKLRGLSQDDNSAVLQALQEVWPCSEGGGMIIQNIVYRIDRDSLTDEPLILFNSSTGWERVDRTMDKLRQQLTAASTVEDFQQVGHMCREGLISLAQAVFDPERHPPVGNDDRALSNTDVKRMIERYLAAEYSGRSNEEVRKCVRSAYDLANAVQHGRSSTYRDASLCVQATFNIVGLIEVISGKRDPVQSQ